jgi:hypothetical protein
MRCVWVLVVACLVAATAVRPPHVELRDRQDAKIAAAPASVALVARQQAPQLPDKRLSAFVVAAAPIVASPVSVAADTSWCSATPRAVRAVDTACARGPPIA